MKSFGVLLRQAREEAGLGVRELARLSGMSHVAIVNYESDKREPTWEAVQRLAHALGVPLESLATVKRKR